MKLSSAVLGFGLSLLAPLALHAEPATLKLAFFASSKEVNYAMVIKPWVDAVNADPANAVKIEAFPDGALGKNIQAQPQMILDGVADIAWVNPSLVPGRFAKDQVLELPGLVKNIGDGIKLYSGLLEQGLLPGYDDYKVIGAFTNPPYHIFSRKPIKELKDLAGQKVRIVGPMVGQTVQSFGMVPVLMPPPEVVEAIGRGSIDAATLVPAALIDFGADRVTTTDYLLPLGAGPLTLLMSAQKYKALSPEARQVLDKYSGPWIQDLYLREVTRYNQDVITRLRDDPKRKVIDVAPDDQPKIDATYQSVTSAWAAQSSENASLLEKARAILAASGN